VQIGRLLPFVDPGEAMPPPLGQLRIDVSTVVDCSRSSAALRRS
jgi:hypothetical protein